jgi:predicted ATPase
VAHALTFAAIFYQLRREPEAARDVAAACITIATEHDLVTYQVVSRFMRGWAAASTGLRGEGLAEMHQARAAMKAAGQKVWGPIFAGMIAEVYGEAGRLEDGLSAVSEGLAFVDETGERYYEAELHRLRGELLLLQHGATAADQADACFHRAFEIARKQEARAWELRAAMSLVRLWQGREKHANARRMLGEIYAGFSEGFDTPDLKDAQTLLEQR